MADTPRILGPKALEMIMRDVLGGMEELASMKGYQPGADVIEIVAIEPAAQPTARSDAPSRVVDFNRFRNRHTG